MASIVDIIVMFLFSFLQYFAKFVKRKNCETKQIKKLV